MNSTPNTEKKNSNLIIILLSAIVVLLCAVLAVFLLRGNGPAQSSDTTSGIPKLNYASEGVTVVTDSNSLQAALDEAARKAAESSIALDYKNQAMSKDGKNFTCYLGNSPKNIYDMYIDIYADMEFKDQIFLSGLIRPGEAFKSIELTRALEPGSHKVYCAFTQVEEDLSTIHSQIVVELEFRVTK